jgi:hypothetical protein
MHCDRKIYDLPSMLLLYAIIFIACQSSTSLAQGLSDHNSAFPPTHVLQLDFETSINHLEAASRFDRSALIDLGDHSYYEPRRETWVQFGHNGQHARIIQFGFLADDMRKLEALLHPVVIPEESRCWMRRHTHEECAR